MDSQLYCRWRAAGKDPGMSTALEAATASTSLRSAGESAKKFSAIRRVLR